MGRPRNRAGVAHDEQGTLRVSKRVLGAMRVIAAAEGKSLFDLGDLVLSNFIERYKVHSPDLNIELPKVLPDVLEHKSD